MDEQQDELAEARATMARWRELALEARFWVGTCANALVDEGIEPTEISRWLERIQQEEKGG